jgi:N-methylhydantoinase B
VLRDVRWRKVSPERARDDYGVLVSGSGGEAGVDEDATARLRDERRAARTGDEPFFDRGPGYARLAGGRTHAEVDVLR